MDYPQVFFQAIKRVNINQDIIKFSVSFQLKTMVKRYKLINFAPK